MVRLYGRAGRLTAKNGGFRPGQMLPRAQPRATLLDAAAAPPPTERARRLEALARARTRRRAKGFAAPAAGAPRRPFECTFREPSPGEPGFDAAGAQRSKLRVSAHGRRLDGRPL